MKIVHADAQPVSERRTFEGGWSALYGTPYGPLPVVSVCGTPEQMGRQYGGLVGGLAKRNAERLVKIFEAAGLPEFVVHGILDNAWARMAPFTPKRYLEEMDGIAQGAMEVGVDLSVADLHRIVAATNFDLYKREERALEFMDGETLAALQNLGQQQSMSCTMLAVWGSRTVDGKMFSFRNLDWLSQSGMHEDKLITVYRPDKGIATVTMGYAGVTGCLAGMNGKGLTLSEVGAFSVREELDGTPWTLIARQMLEDSLNLDEAVAFIQQAKHTIGYNYLVADGDPEQFGTPAFSPCAAAFETNFECCETFFADDPRERAAVWVDPEGKAHNYGLPMTEAIMRADTAFGHRSRELQAADDGPGDPNNTGNPWGRDFSGSSYTSCHKPMHDMVHAYETGKEYVFPVRNSRVVEAGAPRKIGVEETLDIAATVAHNTERLDENDWNVMSVVYAPTDGDFWVAFESCDASRGWKNAPDSGYGRFNFGDLLAG